MERWFVPTVWFAGLAVGVAIWWALLASFGPAVLLVPVAAAAAVAAGGAARGSVSRTPPASTCRLD